jgi:hypothetical protein
MVKVIAGHKHLVAEADSVLEERELPAHMQVTSEPSDFETYGDAGLSDAELLAHAADEAVGAAAAGELLGEAEIDELELRRVLRCRQAARLGHLEVIA